MKTLQTVRLKPNPAGKDRTRFGATETQLGAEWADIKNTGIYDVNLTGVNLYHKAFKRDGSWEWEIVKSLSGLLRPQQVLRIHSGKGPLTALREEDVRGADLHDFTGRSSYIWNNAEGDTAALWEPATQQWIDQASYDPNPPEGVVLVRIGDKLVVPAAASAYARR